MLSILQSVIMRDLTLAWRRRSDVFTSVIFFVIVASLFPLGIGPEGKLLLAIGPGVVWVAALLAATLSLPRMFEPDFADGTLEQIALSPDQLKDNLTLKVLANGQSEDRMSVSTIEYRYEALYKFGQRSLARLTVLPIRV